MTNGVDTLGGGEGHEIGRVVFVLKVYGLGWWRILPYPCLLVGISWEIILHTILLLRLIADQGGFALSESFQ